MIILHVIKNENLNNISQYMTDEYLVRIGFIPCCTNETLKYVLQYYLSKYEKKKLMIVEIDSEKVTSDIKWEEWNKSGNIYPHIYGTIKQEAIIGVSSIIEWDEREVQKHE